MFDLGAPIELRPDSKPSSYLNDTPRITFLVNLWLHHHPLGVVPLPTEILSALTPLSSSIDLQLIQDTADSTDVFKVSPKIIRDESLATQMTIPFVTEESNWGIGTDETGLNLRLWLPKRALTLSSRESYSNVHIVYSRPEVAAYLEYEVDEQAEEDFTNEFDSMVYCEDVSEKKVTSLKRK